MFSIGDRVTHSLNKTNPITGRNFFGSEGTVVGRANSVIWEVDWDSGPGVRYQQELGRFCKHTSDGLSLIDTMSNIPEPLCDDLI